MKTEITKTKNYLVIRVPLKSKRYNPYMEKYVGVMDNICALITKDEFGNEEMGFANWIDRDYKGKDDDISSIWYHWWGGIEEFKNICKRLKIDIIYDTEKD